MRKRKIGLIKNFLIITVSKPQVVLILFGIEIYVIISVTISPISNTIYATYLLFVKFQRRIQNPVKCLGQRFLQE